MKNSGNKIGLKICIIILIFSCTISSSTAIESVDKSKTPNANGNTLYVGGMGPDNYSKIQDAIIDAQESDTVFVYDDSSPYKEDIIINKSIK